jgi:colicin import membrane protein
MSAAAVFEERSEPGQFSSALLSAAMHLLLLAVLIFGVRWQSRPPEAVEVEMWLPPPPAPVVEAPRPEPLPKVEPPPPPVVEKPVPLPPKPEIVEKAAPPKPKPVPKVEPKPPPPKPVAKAEIKPPPKPVAKPEPLVRPKAEPSKPRVDESKRFREELAREQASLAVDRERQLLKDLAARESSAASSKAQAAWIDKVRAKIRGNIVLPPEIKGNPEAVFSVAQLPTGEVLSVKLRKSSGVAALDSAIERAVLKSSPLPKPDSGFTAPREFELRYKPLE